MIEEDKKLIADYMGWCILNQQCRDCYRYSCNKIQKLVDLDLNDAGLCVEKMVEKGDWEDFESFVGLQQALEYAHNPDVTRSFYIYMNDNFFQAMAAWLRWRK